MIEEAKKLTATEALGVMRMFAMALNLVNAAEVQDRLRNIRNFSRESDEKLGSSGPLPIIEDSMLFRGRSPVRHAKGFILEDRVAEALNHPKKA